ncbi:phosphoglucosamine mutase [Methanocella conradii HZ254]|uniref:Phosphoglucosamine mutase n=1 Tax=Methanocella conradii (strain DSM 24694 / JCM 17849 / CGMCC 1.5162 / HZ254) TaxID=1041930 RepID=H8I6A4_METCZ|nr:phosphoglucosamine mutase [Methanocella conradii]AFD00751.1 phosphoglucosamine mutase [Methanocella conradii HZ254]
MSLFGSSGIRGIVNEAVTPELALRAGKALGVEYRSIVVGRDPRTSGQMIEDALVSGLLAMGARVARVGVVSTPTLAYAAREYDCGVMVTASHNPPEYNGLKFWNPDGMAFSLEQQNSLERSIYEDIKGVSWRDVGSEMPRYDAIQNHIDAILRSVEHYPLKVVVDCGCGAASTITPYVLREMGCSVITLNAQPDGFFPARNPEPVDENLSELKKAVIASGADLGIAHDGDADRMMAVDDEGRLVTGDELLAYFCQHEVKYSLACPVDVSMMVEKAVNGARIYRTRIGDAFVSEEVRRAGADFGGETSGTWIFPRMSYCPDGIYAAARLVELVCKNGKLSDAIDALPKYPIRRGGIKLSHDIDKAHLMELIKKEMDVSRAVDVNTLDGLRVGYEDGWVLVRPSGTEPKVRITAEAEDEETLGRLYSEAEAVVKRCVMRCGQ